MPEVQGEVALPEDRPLHRRRVRPRRLRQALRRPSTRRPARRSPRSPRPAREDLDRAVAAARTAFESGPVGGDEAAPARPDPDARGRAPARARRRVRPRRDARQRQADLRVRQDRHAGGRRVPLLLRRVGRQALRRHVPGRTGRVPADAARAGRRRRRDHAVELPAAPGDVEDRAGARARQHRGPEARVRDAADRAPLRRAAGRGGAAAGRLQRRARARAPSSAQAMAEHPGIDKISFTGETETGKSILRAAAGTVKRVSMELGGKSPNIVFADADLDAAAKGAINAIFYGKGELCSAGSRLLVEESRPRRAHGEGRRAREEDGARRPARPEDAPGLARLREAARQRRALRRERQEGRREARRRRQRAPSVNGKGAFFEATVFDGVTPQMTIAREEIFGPVLATLTFKDEAEAVAIGNATIYGLAAAVWSRDIKKALRTAKALKAGTVWINTYNFYDPGLPFGGYKESGFGRERGHYALEEYTQVKSDLGGSDARRRSRARRGASAAASWRCRAASDRSLASLLAASRGAAAAAGSPAHPSRPSSTSLAPGARTSTTSRSRPTARARPGPRRSATRDGARVARRDLGRRPALRRTPRRLTAAPDGKPHREWGAAFSPDGQDDRVPLGRRRSRGSSRSGVAPAAGGPPRQLTRVEGQLDAPPLVARRPVDRVPLRRGLDAGDRARSSPTSRDSGVVAGDDRGAAHRGRRRRRRAASRQVSPADLYVYDYDWSPDGTALRRRSGRRAPGTNNYWVAELYSVDAATGQTRVDLEAAAPDRLPALLARRQVDRRHPRHHERRGLDRRRRLDRPGRRRRAAQPHARA